MTETESTEKCDSTTPGLDEDIIRQLEYYFGDMNLPRDKFLQEQIKLDDGWVPFEVLTKFHRLAKLSSDIKVLADAVAKSSTGILELNDDNTKIRRNPELPVPELNEERRKELQGRSVYVKGFPLDSALDMLLSFFKDYPKVENVIMRKYQDKGTKKWCFKGSVFATFSTKEEAEAFLALKDLKYNDKELISKWQADYLKEKAAAYDQRKEKKEKKDKKQNKNIPQEEVKFSLPEGTTLKFTLDDDKMKREPIKEAITKLGFDVAFVDFNNGDKKGWIRLRKEKEAAELFKKFTEGKLTVGETEITFEVPEKEDELEFLNESSKKMTLKRKNNNQKGRKFNNKKRKVDQDKNGD